MRKLFVPVGDFGTLKAEDLHFYGEFRECEVIDYVNHCGRNYVNVRDYVGLVHSVPVALADILS